MSQEQTPLFLSPEIMGDERRFDVVNQLMTCFLDRLYELNG
jgi:hypothetical protein